MYMKYILMMMEYLAIVLLWMIKLEESR